MGRYVYVACGKDGFLAVPVTEREEPQAVLGSTLHRDAFPERYEHFVEKDHRILHEHHHHGGTDTQSIQLRGEYVYAAEGKSGLTRNPAARDLRSKIDLFFSIYRADGAATAVKTLNRYLQNRWRRS